MLERLKKSLLEAPVFKRGSYNYFIHPITDGVPEVRPELIREVTANIVRVADLEVDKIVTVEAMGIPIGIGLSIICDIPLVIIRKRKYGLPGEIEISQTTGYSKSQLFLNGINKGDRVIVVDDVISTGGTLLATLESLKVGRSDSCGCGDSGAARRRCREAEIRRVMPSRPWSRSRSMRAG